ncbi:flagellar hook protein FlgE [Congregibacter litoralis]|uniref:Flagellar hook protein FlgE n=1 Tax=Congregibacter litoralis KT71 TaxID=314285 RepID=A4A615_9GAMM|nr:flagellar hook protein FlgE [Congregibacter litoralis]EAQ98462.1 flagellar hook-basal body protein [Congregibacter litoralis KT71]
MAFSTAISGINAATADLGVVSNNIANASTTGFKASRAEFADVYATSLLGAGSNAIGKGVSLAGVTQEFGQGNITFTNNSLDLAINGNGFFQLSVEGAVEYTRAGNFQVDREGFLVSNQNARLQGFQVDGGGDVTGQLGDIQIDTSLIDPNPTSNVSLTSNLDSREVTTGTGFATNGPYDAFAVPPTAPSPADFNATTSTTIFDSLGNPHVLSLYYVKTANPNEFEVYSLIDGQSQDPGTGTVGDPVTLQFTSNGQFDPASDTQIDVTAWTPVDSTGAVNGAAAQTFVVDLQQTTQFGTAFAVSSVIQDGFAAGQLRGLEIDESGIAFARYTNGESRALGQIALASFNNQNGLQPVGDTNWVETFSSGSPNVGEPGTSGLGAVQSAALEDSNVEITQELVDLIVAQRNFQANAQVIQAEDAITQTVINLR